MVAEVVVDLAPVADVGRRVVVVHVEERFDPFERRGVPQARVDPIWQDSRHCALVWLTDGR